MPIEKDLIKKKIDEFNRIQKTAFWQEYIERIDREYLGIVSILATKEVAPENEELCHYLIRLQGMLKGIRRIGRLHKKILEELEAKAGHTPAGEPASE